jgi:hypothetical protein
MAGDALIRLAYALSLLAGAIGISEKYVERLQAEELRGSGKMLRLQAEALRTGTDRTGAYIAEDLERSPDMEKKSVLAVISHYVPGRIGGANRRNAALHETLTAMHEWPRVDLTIYVLTNKVVEDVSDMVKDQILVSSDEPVCSETWKHKFCVPWEAIRVLRSASAGDEPTTKLGYELKGEPVYDAYIYSESDLIIPETTFHFWRYHVDTLFKRGYLLLPMRAEDKLLTNDIIAVDCFKEDCVKETEVIRDDETGPMALYKTDRDRHYLRPYNPYSGCFMMSKAQFKAYLDGPMWDYRKIRAANYSPWGVRETAASGLLWAPGFGKEAGLTHLKMRVWHQIPMNGVSKGDPKARIDPSRFHRVDEFQDKVTECLNGTLTATQLHPLRPDERNKRPAKLLEIDARLSAGSTAPESSIASTSSAMSIAAHAAVEPAPVALAEVVHPARAAGEGRAAEPRVGLVTRLLTAAQRFVRTFAWVS